MTLHFVHNEVANERTRVIPEELAGTVLFAIDECAFEEGSICQYHLPLTVLLVIFPSTIIDSAVRFNHAAHTIFHITDPLSLVVGASRVGREFSESLSHFSPEKRSITEVINCPFTLIYSDLVAAMHPDYFLGSIVPCGSSLEEAVDRWIFFVIESKLLCNTIYRTVLVSFVLSLLSILLSSDIFPVEIAFAEPLDQESWLVTLLLINVSEADDASNGPIRACT